MDYKADNPRVACYFRIMKSIFNMTWIVLLVAVSASARVPEFDRYRVILDRKPFGDPPPEPVVPRQPPTISPAESFARHIRLSALYETTEGDIRVGLVNTQERDHFFLAVGESHNGIELVSASFADEEAVLRRGSEMVIVKIADREVQPITREQHEARTRTPQPTSYADRRRARQEALERRRAEPPPEPRLTGQELEEHLKNYQMEVIRQGLPPLPIPLTPEMDQQLVEEGVLPP